MNDKNLQVLEMLKVLHKITIKTGSKKLMILKYIYQIYSACVLLKVFLVKIFLFLGESSIKHFFRKYYKWFFNTTKWFFRFLKVFPKFYQIFNLFFKNTLYHKNASYNIVK